MPDSHYSLVLVGKPGQEPIDLAEAKAHLKVEPDVTEDDLLIQDLIVTAREYCEGKRNYALVTQEWQMLLDAFPCGYSPIVIPKPPLQSITHLKYYDQNNALQAILEGDDFTVDIKSRPGRIFPVYDTVWPSARCAPNAVEVQFKCGYGNAGEVPASDRAAMLLILGQLYENRGDAEAKIPDAAERLLWLDRRVPV